VNKGATSAERSDSLDIGGNEEQGVRRHAAEDGVDSSLDVWVSAAGRGWADSRRRASEPSAPVMRDQLGQVEGGRGGEVAALSPAPPARPLRPQPTGRRPFKRRFFFFLL
jgi:hypothetical protein